MSGGDREEVLHRLAEAGSAQEIAAIRGRVPAALGEMGTSGLPRSTGAR